MSFRGWHVHDTAHFTELTLAEFTPKTFEANDVQIHIAYTAICSSDVHTVTGGWGDVLLPVIAGHEIFGIVEKVGDRVQEFKVGDRVGVGAQVYSCGECELCRSDNEQYCTSSVDTYNDRYPHSGEITYGGYSTRIRANERFVFKIPDGLKDTDVPALLCAGITTYSPLGITEGSKVGVIGIGGLGSFAVQIATALGAHTVAFSHQADKEADCRSMGAADFVDTSVKGFEEKYARKFDFILSTVDDAAGLPLVQALSMLRVNGRFHSCGLPDAPLPEVKAQDLMSNGASISGSHIGSKKEVNALLKLAVEKGIKTYSQIMPMKDVAKGLEAVKNNTVRYRVVLKQDIDQ